MNSQLMNMMITMKAATQSWDQTVSDVAEALKEFKLHGYPAKIKGEPNDVIMEVGLTMAVLTAKLSIGDKDVTTALTDAISRGEILEDVQEMNKAMSNIKKEL